MYLCVGELLISARASALRDMLYVMPVALMMQTTGAGIPDDAAMVVSNPTPRPTSRMCLPRPYVRNQGLLIRRSSSVSWLQIRR